MSHYDLLVVGAGLTGAVIAERAARIAGQKVLIIDERDHAGGNVYDRRNEQGVLFHPYGPHIFHTNAPDVVEYLSRFTTWRPYEHRVLARVDGKDIPVPYNLTSLALTHPAREAELLSAALVAKYGYGARVPVMKLRADEDARLADLGEFVFAAIFHGYTSKQWGLPPEQLSPGVLARVPVHVSHDDRYFQDSFQAMPAAGYAALFDRILANEGISVSLNTAWADLDASVTATRVVYTGPIDGFFGYSLGVLPFRSLRFDYIHADGGPLQPVAQVNYPGAELFTRITEMGHLTSEWNGATTRAFEFPQPYSPGVNLPYYPVPRDENEALHRRYRELAQKEAPHVLFCGRLGAYRYYNMDQAIAAALTQFERMERILPD